MQINTYIAGSSLYHRFDVRAKIIFTILMCIVVFFDMPLYVHYALILLITLLSLTTVKLKVTLHNIKLMLPVTIFMVIFMPLQERGGSALLSYRGFTIITTEGLNIVQVLISRFYFISMICTLLLESSTSRDILLALKSFHLPDSFCMVLSLALRFIPSFASTFTRIKDSQRLRLPNPDEEGEKKSFTKLIPTFTSALVVALKSINTTAAALDLRGYGRSKNKTEFYTLEGGKKLFTHLAISIIIPAIFLITLEALHG